jgi:hypothetical protein
MDNVNSNKTKKETPKNILSETFEQEKFSVKESHSEGIYF